jgi:hypothetical protein
MFNARMNKATYHECNWNDGAIPYSELETLLLREASSAVATYCFGPQTYYIGRNDLLLQSIASDLRKQNLLVVLSTAVIDITQLG